MAKKSAKGSGTIRKKTVIRSGKEYTYWEARVTTGRNPGTGKQVQRSITGKTQKEVREKMQAMVVEVNQGTYTEPCKLTVGEWLDIWSTDYLGSVKPSTVQRYKDQIRLRIKPAMGAVKLAELRPHMIQRFINGLNYSPNTVRLTCSVLREALEKATVLEYIPKNPFKGCELPRLEQKEIQPLDDQQIGKLLEAARGDDMEGIITVALFTGLRLSELLGLTWNAIDFERGIIKVDKQLAPADQRKGGELFTSTKSHKARSVSAAPSVLAALKAQKRRQAKMKLKAGPAWSNPKGLIFTDEAGGPFSQQRAKHRFRSIAAAAGLENTRFHDTRHTYAVNALRAGDDVKTVQSNLGHATAAFTLDRYGHVTEQMRQDSAARMEGFIKGVLGL